MPNKLVFIFAEKEGRRIASALNIISEQSYMDDIGAH